MKHIIMLFITIGIIQNSIAVKYKDFSTQDLIRQKQYMQGRIEKLCVSIEDTTRHTEREFASRGIIKNIRQLNMQQQNTSENDCNAERIFIRQIQQLEQHLRDLESDDNKSIEKREANQKEFDKLKKESSAIRHELDARRNDYYNVTPDNQQDSSIESSVEHNNPVISTQSFDSDLESILGSHNLSSSTPNTPESLHLIENYDSHVESSNLSNDHSSYSADNPQNFYPLRSSTPFQKNRNNISTVINDINLHDELAQCSNYANKSAAEVIEETDQGSSTEDLFVLEDELSDENIENWEFEDAEFFKGDNTIPTTSSEEVEIEKSSTDSSNTPTDAVNTEIASESLGEKNQVELNNESNNINEQITVKDHQLKASIATASASFSIPYQIIKNRLVNNSLVPIAVEAQDINPTGTWVSSGYSDGRQGILANNMLYKSKMAAIIVGGDVNLIATLCYCAVLLRLLLCCVCFLLLFGILTRTET